MARPMRAGRLTRRLTIEEDTTAGDAGTSGDYRQPVPSWSAYMPAWAEVDSGPSRKFWAAKQQHEEATSVITIHWRSDFDITKVIRFTWTDTAGYAHTTYPLGPPINMDANANRWLEFACAEQVA